MKKFLLFFLVLLLVFLSSACSSKKEPAKDKSPNLSSNSKPSNSAEDGSEKNSSGEVENMIVELKDVNPLADFKAPATTTVEYEGKTYTKYYADDISLFKYCGAWQAEEEDPHTMVTYWNVSYVEVDFTGTEILLDFTKSSNFDMSIDNGDYVNKTAEGLYLVKVQSGKHTIRILNKTIHKRVYFGGAALLAGQSLTRTAKKSHYVQFIGDSITQNNPYIATAVKNANWDYSVTARGAMALRTGYGALHDFNPNMISVLGRDKIDVGMEEAFFKLEHPSDALTTAAERRKYLKYFDQPEKFDYNFKTGYYPDIVFVFIGTNDFLGTNDALHLSNEKDFTVRYNNFVSKILKVYGKNTKIYLMEALSGGEGRRHCISAAANKIASNYPQNVFVVGETTVQSWGVEISSDNIHPTDKGYNVLANSIVNYLK